MQTQGAAPNFPLPASFQSIIPSCYADVSLLVPVQDTIANYPVEAAAPKISLYLSTSVLTSTSPPYLEVALVPMQLSTSDRNPKLSPTSIFLN
jgi:hypothetical protein